MTTHNKFLLIRRLVYAEPFVPFVVRMRYIPDQIV
jgi:hypothetical protein